jgi:hypothetical protein
MNIQSLFLGSYHLYNDNATMWDDDDSDDGYYTVCFLTLFTTFFFTDLLFCHCF